MTRTARRISPMVIGEPLASRRSGRLASLGDHRLRRVDQVAPRAEPHGSAELRVLRVITVLWWVLPGPCFGACGAAANSMRVAALSTAFEPAKLEEGEETLVLRLHPQAHGGPCGPSASPCVARHRFGRSLSVHSGRQKERRGGYPLLATLNV